MGKQNKKLMATIVSILTTILSILTIALIVLSILGLKERTGYIEVLTRIEDEFIQSSWTDTNYNWANGVNEKDNIILFSKNVANKMILDRTQYLVSGATTNEVDRIETWSDIHVYLKNATDLKDFEYPNKIYALDRDKKVLNNGNIYQIRIRYYSKLFRNSDIYGVYLKTDNLPEYVKNIEFDETGSPYGYIVSSKELSFDEKIDNVNYILKVKMSMLAILLLILLPFINSLKYCFLIFEKLSRIYVPVTLKLSTMMILGYLFLLIPFLIFIIGWTKIIFSIPITILLMLGFYLMIKDSLKFYNKTYTYNLIFIILIALSIVFIVVIAGIGEVFPPSWDMSNGRNAMFRDIVNFKWPIVFPANGKGMVFYFAHWLVPSLFGKLFGFGVGKLSLVLWTSFGMFIAFILLIMLLNIKKSWLILVVFFMFILFDKLPISVGGYFFYEPNIITIELRSLFNQSIGSWVMTVLFLHQKNARNFVFLGLLTTLYSAYAILGILPFMITKVVLLVKEDKQDAIKGIFSIENIIFTIAIFPILFIFLSSNNTTGDGFKFFTNVSINMLKYYIATFVIYMFLIYKNNKKNYLFYVCLFVFIGSSFIQYSFDWNFNRVNMPSFLIMFYLIVKYLLDNAYSKSIRQYILIFCLSISSLSSLKFIESEMNWFIGNNFKPNTKVGRLTHNTKEIDWTVKTITSRDNTIFFKNIAKKK